MRWRGCRRRAPIGEVARSDRRSRLRRRARRGRACRSRGRADRGIGAARGSLRRRRAPGAACANNCIGRCHRLLNTPQRFTSPSGRSAVATRSGSARWAGIAHHPHRRERQSVLGGERRRDVGFHVDGERAGGAAQRALFARRHHRAVDAGEVGHDHALRMIGKPCGEAVGDDRRCRMAAVRRRRRRSRRSRRRARARDTGRRRCRC